MKKKPHPSFREEHYPCPRPSPDTAAEIELQIPWRGVRLGWRGEQAEIEKLRRVRARLGRDRRLRAQTLAPQIEARGADPLSLTEDRRAQRTMLGPLNEGLPDCPAAPYPWCHGRHARLLS